MALSWTQLTGLPTDIRPIALAYGNSKFVLAGTSGTGAQVSYVYSSDDNGLTWTKRNLPETVSATNIKYVGNKFIVTTYTTPYSSNKGIIYSTDGSNWYMATSGIFSLENPISPRDVSYDGVKYVAVCTTGTARQSSDGITWSNISIPSPMTAYHLSAIHFSSGLWVCGGDNYGGGGSVEKIFTSVDGISNWTARTLTNQPITGIWHNGKSGSESLWVAIGSSGKKAHSVDGTTWEISNLSSSSSSSLSRIRYYGNKWVIVGSSTSGGITQDNYGLIAQSDDGLIWEYDDTSYPINSNIKALAYNNGLWLSGGLDGSNVIKMAYSNEFPSPPSNLTLSCGI